MFTGLSAFPLSPLRGGRVDEAAFAQLTERLAAAGFAEYQPLDPRDDEIAYRRNRRIEFRLTQR